MEKYKKYSDRMEKLIKEFDEQIYPKKQPGNWSGQYYYPHEMYGSLESWIMKAENVLCIIFSENSIQVKRLRTLMESAKKDGVTFGLRLNQTRGLLEACLDDLKNGFIYGQEFVIANEVFDSLLEEAEFFLKKQKNKDISAILFRIVLEDALRRISNKEGISTTTDDGKNKKASYLNDELKKKEFYNQTTWRQIQVWLDIGNDASHGNFDKYDYEQVFSFHEGLVNFITNYFR